MRCPRRTSCPHAFTLVELLVVIGIIAVIASILLPGLRVLRQQEQGLICQSNQRQLWQGMLLFAADHKQHLPGNQYDGGDANPDHRDFLLGGTFDWTQGPEAGTLFKYVNRNYSLYRCPTLDVYRNLGAGSNGYYDYAVFLGFTGAKLEHLPPLGRLTYFDGHQQMFPAPVIVEEAAATINGSNKEGGHSNIDKMASTHRGGSYYTAPDGACYWLVEPAQSNANNWDAQAPSGSWRNMGAGGYCTWGWWDGQ